MIVFEVCSVLTSTPPSEPKKKGAGVLSITSVVTLNVSDTLPILMLALTVVCGIVVEVTCICISCPTLIRPTSM